MKILIASSEVVPFSKTGGLADVAGALPMDLKALGHDVRVVTPKYKMVDERKYPMTTVMDELIVKMDESPVYGKIKVANFPNTDIPCYFVENNYFFDRDQLYTVEGKDYIDNILRFAFYSNSALWMLKGLDWKPDVIMCNDWQTALIPVYLQYHPEIKDDPFYKNIAVLYTIHNLAYQGSFDKLFLPKINVPWELFTMEGLEFYDRINLMKAGIVYSDHISTVSQKYSEEIQTEEYGCGLEGILTELKSKLTGILNGIDYSAWSPEKDDLIPAKFSPKDMAGKAVCKKELQKAYKLPEKDVPVIGVISRLADQKGFDLIEECIEDVMKLNIQLVLLGTGEPKYHEMFEKIAKEYPAKAGISLAFNNKLAHLIEAGSDMFLMPSRYEPCGLNQLYSLKYGTVPIVRKTGGLADSIEPVKKSGGKVTGTGFVFTEYCAKELFKTIKAAVDAYSDKKEWKEIVANGMAKDYSWKTSALVYQKLFTEMIEKKKKPCCEKTKKAECKKSK